MKKELSIRLSLLGRVKLFVAGWADAYANLFSLYLGEKVSTGHVMRITHAVVAFMVLVFSYCSNPLLSMLFLIWLHYWTVKSRVFIKILRRECTASFVFFVCLRET